MSEYTPGPWREVRHGYPTLYQVHAFIEPGIAGLWSPEGNGQQQANARLIAAAPDLLEACKAMRDWIGRCADWQGESPPLQQAANAIVKAEGGAA